MASQVVEFVNSIMTKVSQIPYTWSVEQPDQTRLFQWVAMWNNQIRQWKDKMSFPVAKPACFLQIDLGDAMNMGLGVTLYQNVDIKLHIVDWQMDAGDGTIDQNLEVYVWRDLLKTHMENFFPLHGGCVTQTSEEQDYEHTDVYHYVVNFVCSMTDLKGGILDPDQENWIIKEPPTNVIMTFEYNNGDVPPVDPLISYIWEVYEVNALIVETPNPSNTQTLGNGATIPLEYALNLDGTLTIPYLIQYSGIAVVAPFLLDNNILQNVTYDGSTGTFNNDANGGFLIGNVITFNASLPNL